MTTFNHMAQGALITYALTKNRFLSYTAMILSAIPDCVRLFLHDGWNGSYQTLHSVENWWNHLIPFWNLHVWEDYFTHNQIMGGWLWYTIYLEVIIWGLLIYLVYFLIKKKSLLTTF